MNKKNIFAKVLYIISLVCFYGCLITVVSIFCFSAMISNYDETIGYPIKVSIRSEAADTIVSYKKGSKERIKSTKQLELFRQRTYDVMKDTSYQKALVVQRLALYNNEFQDVSSQFKKTFSPFNNSKGEIFLAPKDPVLSYILQVRYYLVYFLAAFIFWQISRFFKVLGKNFSFHSNLKKRINIIACTLIGYQVIVLTLSLTNMAYLKKAEILTSVPNISAAETVTITYTTYPDYDLQIIFFALALFCIAQLLDYGNKLQQENELTI